MEQKEGGTAGRQRLLGVEHEVVNATRDAIDWVCVVWRKWKEGTEK